MEFKKTFLRNRRTRHLTIARLKHALQSGNGWRTNGDTIRCSGWGQDNGIFTTEQFLAAIRGGYIKMEDGWHRFESIIQSGASVEMVICYGVSEDALGTIDSDGAQRTAGDALAMHGVEKFPSALSHAIKLWIQYHRLNENGESVLQKGSAIEKHVSNSQILEVFDSHSDMLVALEKAASAKRLITGAGIHGILTFLYYEVALVNPPLADRFINVLADPGSIAASDPIYRLREYIITQREKGARKDPKAIVAVAIKALNAAHTGDTINTLKWRGSGSKYPEKFPMLNVSMPQWATAAA